jgi:hypothetical protein
MIICALTNVGESLGPLAPVVRQIPAEAALWSSKIVDLERQPAQRLSVKQAQTRLLLIAAWLQLAYMHSVEFGIAGELDKMHRLEKEQVFWEKFLVDRNAPCPDIRCSNVDLKEMSLERRDQYTTKIQSALDALTCHSRIRLDPKDAPRFCWLQDELASLDSLENEARLKKAPPC